jgi:probable phosphoglycerate mutase
MLRIILTRPGSTEFDEQKRITGTLSIPLSDQGAQQAVNTAKDLLAEKIEVIYTSNCESANQTANALAKLNRVKVKQLEGLQNLDHGLWQGKLIDDVRQKQPKVYRQWQECPETICPPDGEMLGEAQERVKMTLQKILKKHKDGVIAIIAPEPLSSLIRCYLSGGALGNLWKVECASGDWESIDVEPNEVVVNSR